MNKVSKNPSTALLPVPTVLVTAKKEDSASNIITIAWTGILNSNPPIVYISVQPIRHSYSLIKESGEYVINIPSEDQARVVDYCGVTSGSKIDKFKETGLTPIPAQYVKAPLIKECPVNLECRVRDVLSLGSHDVFIADVLTVHYNEDVLKDNGMPDVDKIKPYSFCMREYRRTSDILGTFGYSKKTL